MSVHSYLALSALVVTIAVPLSARAEPDPPEEVVTVKDVPAPTKDAEPSKVIATPIKEVSAPITVVAEPSKDVAAPRPSSWRVPEVNLGFGLRMMRVASAGLDPFATNDTVTQLSLVAGPTLLRSGRVSLAALFEWDYGNKEATARGDKTALTMHRIGLGLESRFQLAHRLMIFAKVSPGAVHLRSTIEDAGLPRPLVSRSWSWALDTTGGLAVMFANTGPREAPTSRFWFTGELGYGFAGQSDMVFAPEADAEDPRKYGTIMLPALRPSGVLGRIAVAVSF